MKTEKNLWLAFALNLCFSLFEFLGGILTGSVSIASDAIHDLADAVSIGASCVLEHKSKDPRHAHYSLIGAAITTGILLVGSVLMILRAISRILHPVPIHYDGMLLFAIVGVAVNAGAVLLTRHGTSVNEKAINLHMLEDVLGWLVVLVGAVIMRFTDFALLDPIMSLGVSLFIGIHATEHAAEICQEAKKLRKIS